MMRSWRCGSGLSRALVVLELIEIAASHLSVALPWYRISVRAAPAGLICCRLNGDRHARLSRVCGEAKIWLSSKPWV